MSLVFNRNGDTLLSFVPGHQPVVREHDSHVPLTWVVVVVQHGGQYLLLHNHIRQQWEIPGGGIEAGEHPDDTARREVQEETSQVVRELRCQGVFKVRLQSDGRHEYGVLYTGTIQELLPFIHNEESDRICLWTPGETLDDDFSHLSHIMMDIAKNGKMA